jgi:hypothetical protein
MSSGVYPRSQCGGYAIATTTTEAVAVPMMRPNVMQLDPPAVVAGDAAGHLGGGGPGGELLPDQTRAARAEHRALLAAMGSPAARRRPDMAHLHHGLVLLGDRELLRQSVEPTGLGSGPGRVQAVLGLQ